jgi:hypothetical protein
LVREYEGVTEPSLDGAVPPHIHIIELKFNDDGKIIKAKTDKVLGHVHKILGLSVTESALGHRHRFFVDQASKVAEESNA